MIMPQPGVPAPGQPMYLQAAYPGNANPMAPAPPPAGVFHPEPALGIGLTGSEMVAQHNKIAADTQMDEPQEMKPADDDPSRMYRCREVDGNWTLRNRFAIDHMKEFRWYVTDDGVFYAVRIVQ